MTDKTGRTLEKGQVVDVLADGILSAYVIDVREGGIVGVDGRTEPATLVLQIAIPIKLSPGQPAPVYITRQTDRPKESERIM